MTASPDQARFHLVDLPYEDVDQRCRTCGKRMVVDPGIGVTGDHEALIFCLQCDRLTPETSWALYGINHNRRESRP